MGDSYRRAGVDIDAGTAAKQAIRAHVQSTHGPAVLGGLGGFGGLFQFSGTGQSVLVASTDSVGTKVMLAATLDRHDTVGADLVNHCVNDILACGARPLFFLDYIGSGRVVPTQIEQLVAGVALACRENDCALIGGETAELPGLYRPGDYDLAGTIVGTVERDRILDGSAVQAGDALIGLPSSGLHTNGYSLARRVLGLTGTVEHDRPRLLDHDPALGSSWADALMAVHRSYLRPVWPLLEAGLVHSMAHITGGGLIDNVPRALPEGLAARFNQRAWAVPAVCQRLGELGQIAPAELYRVFNMGLGLVLVCAPGDVTKVLGGTPDSRIVGEVVPAIKPQPRVSIDSW